MTKAPSNLQDLRRRIYRKAKSDQTHRFWGLFVHITKIETLEEAYQTANRNGGAPGIDGQSFEDIEKSGLTDFLVAVREDLVSRQIQTQAKPPGRNPERERQSQNAPDSLHPRSRGARSTEADPRSHLRGRLLPELVRISTPAFTTSRPGGSQAQCDAANDYGHRC